MFELNLNDYDTISAKSISTINASIVKTPAIPEFDSQIRDIEVEKNCDNVPYNVIDDFTPIKELKYPTPHWKKIQRNVASVVKKSNHVKRK